MAPLLSAALVSAMQAVVPADDIAEEFQYDEKNYQIKQAAPQFATATSISAAITEIKHCHLSFSLYIFLFRAAVATATTHRPISREGGSSADRRITFPKLQYRPSHST